MSYQPPPRLVLHHIWRPGSNFDGIGETQLSCGHWMIDCAIERETDTSCSACSEANDHAIARPRILAAVAAESEGP